MIVQKAEKLKQVIQLGDLFENEETGYFYLLWKNTENKYALVNLCGHGYFGIHDDLETIEEVVRKMVHYPQGKYNLKLE